MAETSKYLARMPAWVLIAAALGVATGVFFGEDAVILRPVGSIYVKLMQIAVYPYIICTLLHGLGRLAPNTAWRLFRCSWLVYLAMWGLTFLVIFLMSLAIPEIPPPSFIDARASAAGPSLIDLLIPTNLFEDLAANHVPAIVIFCILYGVAVQKIKDKEAFLSFLDLIKKASLTIWDWVVLLSPLGVFALFADVSGTLSPDTLASLSVYVAATIAGTAILAFWILPSIVAAFAPVTTREILYDMRNALVLALVTTLSVVALPFVARAAERLAGQMEIEDDNRQEVINTTLAISYPLAQLGNFFIWLFVLYAAYRYRTPLSTGDQVALPILTLLSGFGSPSSSIDAVAFLTQWLSMPDAANDLYVSMMTITRYGTVLATVMGYVFVTFLVTMIYYGKVRVRPWRLASAFGVGAILTSATVLLVSNLRHDVIHQGQNSYAAYQLDPDTTDGISVVVDKTAPADGTAPKPSAKPSADRNTTERIIASGEVRVGFNPDMIPFSYRNDKGELVGLDIAYAYRLARDLNVRLRLIPFSWKTLDRDIANKRFDLAASGIFVSDARLEQFNFSEPYTESPVALIVRARDTDRFLNRTDIESRTDLTIAIIDDPVMAAMAKKLFPKARQIVRLPDYDALPHHPEVDATLSSLAHARAWTALRTTYTAIVPKNLASTILFAFLMPDNSDHFRDFVDYWLRVQQATGFRDRMIKHWIDGNPDTHATPRWSVLRTLEGR